MKLPKIDYHKLNYWLTADIETLFKGNYHSQNTRFLFTRQKGAKILAVAHLDTVQELTAPKYNKNRSEVQASGLDDRLGAYLASNWLKDNGIVCDVLLTDNEEHTASTAQFFNGGNNYNWIVEFDRMGEDVVTYDMDCPDWLDELRTAGFVVARGIFSDISFLQTERCAVNIGVGYRNYHSKDALADLNVTRRQLARFLNLYHRCEDMRFDQLKHPALSKTHYERSMTREDDLDRELDRMFPDTKGRPEQKHVRLCECCDGLMPCEETMYGIYCEDCIETYGILSQ